MEDDKLKTVAFTVAAVLLLQRIYASYQAWDPEKNTDFLIRVLLHLPIVGPNIQAKIDEELASVTKDIEKSVDKYRQSDHYYSELPLQGVSRETLLNRLKTVHDYFPDGKVSGAAYTAYGPETLDFLAKVYRTTALTNPLHPEWSKLGLMQAEIIAMCQTLMHGSTKGHGILTHGGTTSIIHACYSYVRKARDNGIEMPEILVPNSAHIAFQKAADLLHAKLVKVPVNPTTGKADVNAMQRKINRNTCMIVGSAPSFAYGVMDPIEDLGKLANMYQIPLHVDACHGGFIIAFANKAGYNLPPSDFSVAGVTSISVDPHKHDQTPKGSSVLVYREGCNVSPTMTYLNWQGGMYVTDSMDGSRSGADIATTHATLLMNGKNKYVKDTRSILLLKHQLAEQIETIEGLDIPYEPETSVIGIHTTDDINPTLVAHKLQEDGWSVNIIQGDQNKVVGFHFCITLAHTQHPTFIQDFTTALTFAVEHAKNNPHETPVGLVKAYGALQSGVPFFVQKTIGDRYARLSNRLPGVKIPGINDFEESETPHPSGPQ